MSIQSRPAVTSMFLVLLSGCMFDRPADVPDLDAMPSGYRISGTIAGLWDGATATLELTADGLAAPVPLTIDANGAFTFDAALDNGATFEVTVAATATGHTCDVESGAGTVDDVDVDDVVVTCDGPAVDVAFSAPIPLSFDTGTVTYDVDTSVVIQQTRLTVTAPDATNIRINQVTGYDSGDTTAPIGLLFGQNELEIAVEVEAASRTFIITIDRGAAEIAQHLYAKAANADPDDRLGGSPASIAIDGDTLVVGAWGEASASGDPGNNGAGNSGAVYVFRRVGEQWHQEGYLKASAIDPDDDFGMSVDVSGDLIAVGAPREDSAAVGINGNDDDDSVGDTGAVYVYRRAGASWVFDAYVKPGGPVDNLTNFGRAVTIDGDTLAVGVGHPFFGGVRGVWVFTRTVAWSQQAYIPPPVDGDNDLFGSALDLDGDQLAIGARSEASCATGVDGNQFDNNCAGAGAAYVYARSGSSWTRQAYLKASNTDAEDGFGMSVAIDGNIMVVGASGEDSASASTPSDDSDSNRGAVYVFRRSGTDWSQTAFLKSSDATSRFGTDVAIAGDLIAASIGSGLGPITIFRDMPGWSEVALVQSENVQTGDAFGACIGLSPDGLVAGAPGEDATATGINPVDDGQAPSSNEVGAAYTFR